MSNLPSNEVATWYYEHGRGMSQDGRSTYYDCSGGPYVRASDFDRALAERDAAEAENERLRAALEKIAEFDCRPDEHVGELKCWSCYANEALTGDSSAPETTTRPRKYAPAATDGAAAYKLAVLCLQLPGYQNDQVLREATDDVLARFVEKTAPDSSQETTEIYTQEALDAAHARTRERLATLKVDEPSVNGKGDGT